MQKLMRRCGTLIVPLVLGMLAGCSPEQVLGSNKLPPDVSDPALAKTPDGALANYRGAVDLFRQAFGGHGGDVITPSALLTDELQDGNVGLVTGIVKTNIDARYLPEFSDPAQEGIGAPSYSSLQRARAQIGEAERALAAYAPNASPALRGRLYAMEGYTEVFLADLFCSGIPLSTLDLDQGFTYAAGSTTQEVYQGAVAHFDSALALASDSVEVINLARVGKGRALLALGDYAGAGAAVTDVPDAFSYAIGYGSIFDSFDYINFAASLAGGFLAGAPNAGAPMMADGDGGNGLLFRSSGDPRTTGDFVGNNAFGIARFRPTKYGPDGSSSIILADATEARLIEAEAQLQAGDASWLATLNALRTDGTFDTQPDPNDATKTDTLWHAGTGGVAGLAPLGDPGASDARVNLVFQERGYWLFLTGHRQGDLRRLVREYGRDAEQVYPTGAYAGGNGSYGTDVNFPIPATERVYNSKFTGCFSRGA